jgi:hypothetical protein
VLGEVEVCENRVMQKVTETSQKRQDNLGADKMTKYRFNFPVYNVTMHESREDSAPGVG